METISLTKDVWIAIFTLFAVVLATVYLLWNKNRSIQGNLCYLEANNKRWLIVGICLHTVISPALRNYVRPKLDHLWHTLNNSHNISSQQHPNQMPRYQTTYLNYEAINNNKVHGLRQQRNFDYKVKNSVALSKLFLNTNMAQYSDFDETCDLSALLGIVIKTGICSSSAKQYAKQFREAVRNPWAHCNYTQWDQTKYTESPELIEKLVQNLGLAVPEERQIMSDLEKWRGYGKEFIDGKTNVMVEVTKQVQNMIRYAESIVGDNPEVIKTLKEQLIIAENTLSNLEQRIGKLEEKTQLHEQERQIFFKGKSELIETKLKNWKEDDKTFVVTKAVKSILKCVAKNKCVTIIGSSGMGKTAILRHIVLQMADKGYDIIPVNEPRDIEQYYSAQRKTVFMIDDFCGKFSANKTEVDKWKTFIDQTYTHLNNNVKLVVACRLQVFKDNLFQTLTVFKSNKYSLLSKDLKLSNAELQSIASMYLKSEAEKVTEYVNSYPFFPLLCTLYTSSTSLQITDFFQKPFSVYETDMDNMLAAGHDRKYCALLLCVVFNNSLEESLLTGVIDEETCNIFRNVFETCRLNRDTSRIVILDELNTLLSSYLQKEEGCYKTVHDKIFDFLSFYFGKNKLTCQCLIQNARGRFIAERFSLFDTQLRHEFIIEIDSSLHDMYIERMLRDWLNSEIDTVVGNANMELQKFRHKLLLKAKSCNQPLQEKIAHTYDKEHGASLLFMCCWYGDMDWLTWCLNQEIDVNKCKTDDGGSPLCVACQEGHKEIVNILLDRGADINKCRTNDGVSPLFTACFKGHTEIVTILLGRGADINKCRTDNGVSPLFIACQEGHNEIVTILLDRGADINKCNTDNGVSPLFMACQEGHNEIVTILLDRGADMNTCRTDDGTSPLFIACQEGHREIVTILLDRGADINKCKTVNGASPLFIACQNGHTEIVTILLDRGADMNKCRTDDGTSPLYIACKKDHTEIVTILLDRGADMNKCRTNDGVSPLFMACQEGHNEIVTLLLDRGADINKCKTDNGASPLFIACFKGHREIVTILLDRGADINKCTTDDGTSPLYIACQKGYTEIVTILLDRGAGINKCRTDNGISPLFIACQNGHTEIVTILLDRGADINKCGTDDGSSHLYIACQNGHTEIVNILLDKGADMNKCRTDDGTSPLYIACQEGHTEIVTILLDRGTDINRCTTDDRTSPLFIACQNGHTEIITILLDREADINKCKTDNGASPLYIACQNGHTEIVTILLDRRADMNKCRTNDGVSPLFMACQKGYTEIVTILLDREADINKCRTDDGASPLHVACYYGHNDIVRLLLCKGANSDIKMRNGFCPVDFARKMNHNDIVTMFETLK